MKHAVIVAHPSPDSFNLSAATAYCQTVSELGHTVVLRDLYRMGFDPLLKAGEIPMSSGFAAGPDVVAERRLIGDADVFTFIYPLWFYLPPAALVGYLDRVMGMGFGYGPIRSGGNEPLLVGKKLFSITSTGSPEAWVQKEGALGALKLLLDEHFAAVCGLEVVGHVHLGSITASATREAIHVRLVELRHQIATTFRGHDLKAAN
jgi:NAD(P)H dehydrogenase (quinone)